MGDEYSTEEYAAWELDLMHGNEYQRGLTDGENNSRHKDFSVEGFTPEMLVVLTELVDHDFTLTEGIALIRKFGGWNNSK